MPLKQLTLSEPVPDLECLNCGKVYQYDGVNDWDDCLVLKDTRFTPPKVGCWCDEGCLNEWLDSADAREFFPVI